LSILSLRGKNISERSLELNVLSEALEYIRKLLGKAYIVGYTARQEARHGLDVSINAPGIIIAAYQFKAPRSGRKYIYRFTIGDRCWVCSNPRLGSQRHPYREIIKILKKYKKYKLPDTCVNQHVLLYAAATVLENKVGTPIYYAFPLVRNYTELEKRMPGILDYTVLIRVRVMPIWTVLDCKPHHVEIVLPANNPHNITVKIRSRYKKLPKGKYALFSEVLKRPINIENLPRARQAIHLNPEELQQILKKELEGRTREEDLEPELIERVPLLAKAITMTSFSYQGTTIVSKRRESKH